MVSNSRSIIAATGGYVGYLGSVSPLDLSQPGWHADSATFDGSTINGGVWDTVQIGPDFIKDGSVVGTTYEGFVDNVTLAQSVVPEPVGLSLGLCAMGLLSRRKRP